MKLKNLINKFSGDTAETVFYVVDNNYPLPCEMNDEMHSSLYPYKGISELCEDFYDSCLDVKDIFFDGNEIYLYVKDNGLSTDFDLSEFIASVTELKEFEPFYITFQNEDSSKMMSLTVDDENVLDFLDEFASDTEMHVTAVSATKDRVISISVVDDETFEYIADCFKIKFCKKTKIN